MKNFQTPQGFGGTLESSFAIPMHVPPQIMGDFHPLGVAGAVESLPSHCQTLWTFLAEREGGLRKVWNEQGKKPWGSTEGFGMEEP